MFGHVSLCTLSTVYTLTLFLSQDYSGSLIGISISATKPVPDSVPKSSKKQKSSKSPKWSVPALPSCTDSDGGAVRLVQIHCSLSSPMEYSLFRQYIEEALGWATEQWLAEFEQLVAAADTDSAAGSKVMICSCSPNDPLCAQWIEFLQNTANSLTDGASDDSLLCQFSHSLTFQLAAILKIFEHF